MDSQSPFPDISLDDMDDYLPIIFPLQLAYRVGDIDFTASPKAQKSRWSRLMCKPNSSDREAISTNLLKRFLTSKENKGKNWFTLRDLLSNLCILSSSLHLHKRLSRSSFFTPCWIPPSPFASRLFFLYLIPPLFTWLIHVSPFETWIFFSNFTFHLRTLSFPKAFFPLYP